MIISGKIAKLFEKPGFINIDYLIKNHIYASPSVILNILAREWRRWKRPKLGSSLAESKAYDPTFGYTEVGGSSSSMASGRVYGCKYACPDYGTAQSMSAYCYAFWGTRKLKLALYDSAVNYVGECAEITNWTSTHQWYTSDFVDSPSISPQDYWLCFRSDYIGYYRYDPGETNQAGVASLDYSDPWPSSITWSDYNDYKISIYCTYVTVEVKRKAVGDGLVWYT